MPRRLTVSLCFLSALILTVSFQHPFFWILAWFGLVPLFYGLDQKSAWGGFKTGFLFGLFYFTGTLYWFFHLSSWFSFIAIFGVCLLFLYLSLYPAIFGAMYCSARKFSPVIRLFFIPSVWVCLEYVRGILLTGFGWGFIGHTQYTYLAVIQIADITGVYGISFLLVMANVFVKEIRQLGMKRSERLLYRFVFYACLLSVLVYGCVTVIQFKDVPTAKVAVLQGNIDQDTKWSAHAWPIIMDRYTRLTQEAARDQPDLIIWPESSLPGFIGDDQLVFEQLKALVRNVQIPVLVGTVVRTRINQYLNSALLMSTEGEAVMRYDKIHLVAFGEYLPWRYWIPDQIEKLIPVEDFKEGRKYGLFTTATLPAFNALICFEDTASYLARNFAQQGSHFFINMTNDGWFKDSYAPLMHLQVSMFRAIEHRRTLVRAANTGVSGFVDPIGRITHTVTNEKGKASYVQGWMSGPVYAANQPTFYTKFGNVFTFMCFLCILMSYAIRIRFR